MSKGNQIIPISVELSPDAINRVRQAVYEIVNEKITHALNIGLIGKGERLIKVTQLQDQLGISRNTWFNWKKRFSITTYSIAGTQYVKCEDIEALIIKSSSDE